MTSAIVCITRRSSCASRSQISRSAGASMASTLTGPRATRTFLSPRLGSSPPNLRAVLLRLVALATSRQIGSHNLMNQWLIEFGGKGRVR